MNTDEFRQFAKCAIDYIADYLENIKDRPVASQVEPGYLSKVLPVQVPNKGESWKDVLKDVDQLLVPGLTHWHSPRFHAYYPTANSYPGIVGELFLSGLGVVSNDWESSPACVELEVLMMDWLAKILGLPEYFLNSSKGPGGGVIQNAASESTLVGLLAAKRRRLRSRPDAAARLVAYSSEQANSSVEKAGLLASVRMALLPTDGEGRMRGSALREAVRRDKARGLVPCCAVATLGTTGTCAFDDLEKIGKVCDEENMWLHVDAAYAGTALSCPEYRYLAKGIEYVDSFNFNPHKWMLVNSDCSAMWFKNTKEVEEAFVARSTTKDPLFEPQIEHWQIPNTRRFRALKLWFVLRTYGVEGIQNHVRKQISLAKYFEELVRSDERFEVCASSLGVVCFRLQVGNEKTQELLNVISARNKIFVMPYVFQEKVLIRFVLCSRFTEKDDVLYTWDEIRNQADVVIESK